MVSGGRLSVADLGGGRVCSSSIQKCSGRGRAACMRRETWDARHDTRVEGHAIWDARRVGRAATLDTTALHLALLTSCP